MPGDFSAKEKSQAEMGVRRKKKEKLCIATVRDNQSQAGWLKE